jgi:hypothetical protein
VALVRQLGVFPRLSGVVARDTSGPVSVRPATHGSELSDGVPAAQRMRSAISVFGDTEESTGSAPVASETYAGECQGLRMGATFQACTRLTASKEPVQVP